MEEHIKELVSLISPDVDDMIELLEKREPFSSTKVVTDPSGLEVVIAIGTNGMISVVFGGSFSDGTNATFIGDLKDTTLESVLDNLSDVITNIYESSYRTFSATQNSTKH